MAILKIITLFLLLSSASADTFYQVKSVTDGDTLSLDKVGKVRLIGVDTPESNDPRKTVEVFSKEAKDFLIQLTKDKAVRLEYDQTKKDKFDRTLAYLYLKDGTLINKKIIEEGYGHAYVRFPFKKMKEFRRAEKRARKNKKGLWSDKIKAKIKEHQKNCKRRRYCSKMKTCKEAMYQFKVCKDHRLDGDGDGIPCEALCE